MASAMTRRPRRTRPEPSPRRGHVFAYVPVYLPPGCSDEQADALILQAFEREVEMRGGKRAEPTRPVADLQVLATSSPASPRHCRTPGQFLEQLDQLRRWAGLSLKQLEQRARERGYAPLPHSSIGRLLSPRRGAEARMPTREQLTSIVLCCDVSEDQWRDWAIMWERVQPDPAQVNKPWVLPGEDGDRVVSLRRRVEDDLKVVKAVVVDTNGLQHLLDVELARAIEQEPALA